METYWRKYSNNNSLNELIPHQHYYIEYDDRVLSIKPSHIAVTVRTPILDSYLTPPHVVLKEVPRKEVIEALKSTINRLNLPKEINILKHKF